MRLEDDWVYIWSGPNVVQCADTALGDGQRPLATQCRQSTVVEALRLLEASLPRRAGFLQCPKATVGDGVQPFSLDSETVPYLLKVRHTPVANILTLLAVHGGPSTVHGPRSTVHSSSLLRPFATLEGRESISDTPRGSQLSVAQLGSTFALVISVPVVAWGFIVQDAGVFEWAPVAFVASFVALQFAFRFEYQWIWLIGVFAVGTGFPLLAYLEAGALSRSDVERVPPAWSTAHRGRGAFSEVLGKCAWRVMKLLRQAQVAALGDGSHLGELFDADADRLAFDPASV